MPIGEKLARWCVSLSLIVGMLLFVPTPLHAYIDVIPTLGRMISESRLIVVLQVEKVDRQQRVILFRVTDVLANLDKVDVPPKIRHQVAAGLHPREPKQILDWAQPGRTAVSFVTDKLAVTCIGDTWYEASQLDPRSFVMVRGRGELSYAYSGPPDLLKRAVAAILANHEVTITAVRQGTPDNRAEEAVAFKQALRGRDIPMWRLRASLKMPATVGEVTTLPQWVVGIGVGDSDDVPELVVDLKASEPERRRAAAEMLGRIGRPAKPVMPSLLAAARDNDAWTAVTAAAASLWIDPRNGDARAILQKMMKAEEPAIRRAAVTAVGDLGRSAQSFVEPLIAAVGDSDPEVRWAAIESLGQCREAAAAAVPVLQDALKKPELRPAAVAALGMIGPAAKGAEGDISALIDDRDESMRWAAAIALLRIDNRATDRLVPLFLSAAASSNPRTRWDAVWYFDHLHEPRSAVDGLTKLVSDDDDGIRISALLILGNMGPVADGATPAISRALHDRNLLVREAAARAVPQMGIEDPAVVERAAAVWADVFSQTDPPTPQWILDDAGHYLKKLGSVEAIAEPTLQKLLSHPAADVRRAALEALANLGSEAKGALPAATICLNDREPRVRLMAARAVWDIGGGAAPIVPPLIALVKTGDPQFRAKAASLLKEVGPAARDSLAGLTACLIDPDPAVRLSAAEAVWAIDRQPQAVLPIFRAALNDIDASYRQRAAKGLGELGRAALPADSDLRTALHDRDVRVRVAAATSLHGIDAQDSAPLPVLATALDDADDSVREDAAEALARYGAAAKSALPVLREMLTEGNPELRFAAGSAILRISPDDQEALSTVIATLSEGDVDLRLRAIQCVGELGPKARGATDSLIELSKADNDALATSAKQALAKVAAPHPEIQSAQVAATTEMPSENFHRPALIWAAAAVALAMFAAIAARLVARHRKQ